MKKLSIIAIISGFLFDTVGSTVTGFLYGIAWAIFKVATGTSAKDISSPAYVQEHLYNDPLSITFLLMIGLLFTVMGGALTGWLAPASSRLLNASIVGGIDIVLGLFMASSLPIWYNVVSFIMCIPCALAGAYLIKLIKSEV